MIHRRRMTGGNFISFLYFFEKNRPPYRVFLTEFFFSDRAGAPRLPSFTEFSSISHEKKVFHFHFHLELESTWKRRSMSWFQRLPSFSSSTSTSTSTSTSSWSLNRLENEEAFLHSYSLPSFTEFFLPLPLPIPLPNRKTQFRSHIWTEIFNDVDY